MSGEPADGVDRITSVSRVEPLPAGGFSLRADDHGAFGAVDAVRGQAVALRPALHGLYVERESGRELVPWDAVTSVRLRHLAAGRLQVPGASVDVREGPSVDLAAMHRAGVEHLPDQLGPGSGPLLRVDRLRLLVATVVAAAGLERTGADVFERADRSVPVPELALRPRILPGWAPPLLVLLSVVALMLVFQLSAAAALAITLVLLFHEYGHVAVMRMLKMKVRGVLLLPLLGAATVPEHAFASRWDEARVALAGPATGVPLAALAFFLWILGQVPQEIGEDLFVWILGLNLLNLVPLMPLDGGRALLSLVAGLPGTLRYGLALLPLTAATAGLLLLDNLTVAFAGAIVVVFAFVVTRLALKRYALHYWMEAIPLDLRALRAALRDVTDHLDGRPREDVDGGVAPCPLTGRQALAVIGLYIGQVLLLVVLLGVTVEMVKAGG